MDAPSKRLDAVLARMDWCDAGSDAAFVLRVAHPSQEFWVFWGAHKAACKAAGVTVVKSNGRFIVRWVQIVKLAQAAARPVSASTAKLLREYQVPHVARLISRVEQFGAALDGSDLGTGKTFCALAVARELKKRVLVLAAVSAVIKWQRAADLFGVETLDVLTYQKLKMYNTPWLKIESDRFVWHLPKDALVILDEAHWAKAPKTKNGLLAGSLRDANVPALLLSATIGDNPLHFKNLGYLLRLFPKISDYWEWARRFGARKGPWGGLEFSFEPGEESLRDDFLRALHLELYGARGSRIRIAELPPGAFPETQIEICRVQVDDAALIEHEYCAAVEGCAVQKSERRSQSSALDRLESELELAPSHLVAILRFRQIAEFQKVSVIAEMAKVALAEGASVIIFVCFHETIRALAVALDTDAIVSGREKRVDVDRRLNAFQRDIINLIILQVDAGGQSIDLHDVRGERRRVALISPTWSAQNFKQVLGRPHREGGRSVSIQRILIAAETVEEKVAAALEAKLSRLHTLNDGDLNVFEGLGSLGRQSSPKTRANKNGKKTVGRKPKRNRNEFARNSGDDRRGARTTK